MPEVVYVESSSDDESYVESSSEERPNEKVIVSNRETKKIKDSNQLIVTRFVDKEKKTNEEIEALKKCNDYWKEIAHTRLKNIETMNVALDSQSKRIYELERSISDTKAEELRAKKARYDSCKPHDLDSTKRMSNQYGIVVHSIPTKMNLNSSDEIKSFQIENFGFLNSLTSIQWINPRNLVGKLNSSIVIYLSDLNEFEILLKKSYVLFDKQVKQVKKFVSNFHTATGPGGLGKVVCFKCEGVGHFARDCISTAKIGFQRESEESETGQVEYVERFLKSIID
ncbi:uncharacterized protein MELLADRAFT_67783 [Melampsora larici-populina 98AG31]|uniref:CCHC-type domain-containing protein n=1 Tax=Melampsora larici-populina (strain 98AG31 / pathotype 3-4-7) TaxID=747676 RepID=F4S4E3_MELLP|nr:uncharacterized protein MELLADRAFT_67783 [Melampsora larici-populina 98AG31]EGG00484.1 hypothetical protein MELLADRAFT_67783 [Melampsora larici-populina 98AG31]